MSDNPIDRSQTTRETRLEFLTRRAAERGAELQALQDAADELIRVYRNGFVGKLPSEIAYAIGGLAHERERGIMHYAEVSGT